MDLWRRPVAPTAPEPEGRAEISRPNSTPSRIGAAPYQWRGRKTPSADSQFFICFDDASFLDGQYTVWGEVTEGMENVDRIKRGEPVQNPDRIITARILADAA